MSGALLPFADFPEAALAAVKVIAADVDDTITTRGKIPAATLDAFAALADRGLLVALVTGRPAGWAQALAGYLPGVAAAVGENGLVMFDGEGRRRDLGPAARPESFAAALADGAARVKAARGLVRTNDDDFRLFERTFERPAGFGPAELGACAALLPAGLEVIASSIHIHVRPSGWGKDDGLLAALDALGAPLAADDELLFVGDSANDRPLFRRFPRTSVGVSNVGKYLAELGEDRPRWVTAGEGAEGFVEIARRRLARPAVTSAPPGTGAS